MSGSDGLSVMILNPWIFMQDIVKASHSIIQFVSETSEIFAICLLEFTSHIFLSKINKPTINTRF